MNTIDRTVASLKPAALDTVENTPADQARIPALTAASRERSRRRVPKLPIALIAAGAVAAAAVVPVALPEDTPRSTPAYPNAQAFLLAGAQSAERAAPPSDGKYWFTRARSCHADTQRGIRYTICSTHEEWTSKDGFVRNVVGIDQKITFASARDEAAWKSAGSPRLGQRPAWTEHRGRIWSKWGLDGNRLTLDQLRDLPTDQAALRKVIAKSARGNPDRAELDGFIWTFAPSLFTQPITPGTRAGLYRLLAAIPGVRLKATAKAPDGGKATVLSLTQRQPSGPGWAMQEVETYLTFRSDTHEFLGDQFGAAGQVTWAYLKAEWTSVLGARRGAQGRS